MKTVTKEQMMAAMEVMKACADAIKESGSIPSGQLYACMMATGMSLDQYEKMIEMLCRAGLVSRGAGHLLHWIG